MESLDQEFASQPGTGYQNGQHAPARPDDHFPQDVEFAAGPTDVMPHAWACWIFTEMRKDELSGKKPRPFSAWLGACVLANRGK